jgi:predicted O-linked N-acetylglucosamine transferase (SPINDLY family)
MSKIKTGGRKSFAASHAPRQDADTINLVRLVERKQYADLEKAARQVLNGKPGHGFALKALGFALLGLRRNEEALPLLRHMVALNPHDPELRHNLGIALSQLMYWDESLTEFREALAGLPNDPEVHKDMGLALFRMQRWNDAVPSLLKAIELHEDDYIEAVELLAACLLNANRVDEAWTCYRELHQAEPEHVQNLFQFMTSSLRSCYWSGFADALQKLRDLSAGFDSCAASPFALASFPGVRLDEFLKVAHNHAAASIPASVLDSTTALSPDAPSGRRMRVGYLSGDLRRHAVGFIIPEVMERHDRSRFEVFAYSTHPADPGDPIRPRLEQAFEHFNEVSDLFVRNLSEKIRADGIDVLVDLSGWTSHGRPEVLALRSAPVQVNWLGYPGTMGHSALADYIIGDPVVTPLGHAKHYSETIAQLPHCYLPADTRRGKRLPPTRAAAGLPEEKFVFCSFNNSYKYNPDVWDLWCSILAEAPDAVLWLGGHGDTVSAHLLAESEKRGIEKNRIIFAPHVPSNEDHLARQGLADLALDPFPYNAHSTAVDALAAGVPMLTLLGDLFAGRVGASVVTAAGLPELVVNSREAYRALAVDLYRDRQRLSGLRQRLANGSHNHLFDMAEFVEALESLYSRMLDDAAHGLRRPLSVA